MAESNSILEALSKLKIVGYFLIFWGGTFFFRGLTDLAYYVANYGSSLGESLAETVFYLIGDVFWIAAAIALWALSAKLLRKK
jgi:hypothetical protein